MYLAQLEGPDGFPRPLAVKKLRARPARDPRRVARDSTPMLTSRELAYLSPEHARGEAVDARSDVFALGVMLYELTTGVHPYLDPSSEPTCRSARDRLVHAELQPPAQRLSWFPLELSDVVMTALARDPELRYGDARAFGRALGASLRGRRRADRGAERGGGPLEAPT